MQREEGIRLIATPVVGLVIASVTGLLGTLSPSSWLYWAGCFYFMLTSLVTWQTNRFFYLRSRDRFDWLTQPARRFRVLLMNMVLCTVPTMVGMLWLWYRVAGFDRTDWTAIRNTTVIALIFSGFITSTYETVRLIKQRSRAELKAERLERSKLQAELAALKAQIDPHFMFNSLNTLAGLIEEDPHRAAEFNQKLAEIYRYILGRRNQELVPLREEVEFLENYYALLKLRFEGGIEMRLPAEPRWWEGYLAPPSSLQVLLENAIKHNECSEKSPLVVTVAIADGEISFHNPKRPPLRARPSAKVGLRNLDERCRLVLNRSLTIENGASDFRVRVPLRST